MNAEQQFQRFAGQMEEFQKNTRENISEIKESIGRIERDITTILQDAKTRPSYSEVSERVEKEVHEHASVCVGAKPSQWWPETVQGWIALIVAIIAMLSAFFTGFFAIARPQIERDCKAAAHTQVIEMLEVKEK